MQRDSELDHYGRDAERYRSKDEHKKKKKHKHQREQRSRSRSHHKKKHHDSKHRDSRGRSGSERKKDKKHKHKQSKSHRERSEHRNRDQTKNQPSNHIQKPVEPRILDEKDPYFEERKEIEKVRKANPSKAQEIEEELEKRIIFDKKQKQYDEMKEKFKEAQKEMQEAKREDHTILVYCLPLKAKQKDIWNFFIKAGCGRIRDIRIIKDGRSGKSKGVAYVEFYTSESVEKALTMSERPFELKGREFMGLKVQHSQAEKNRAAHTAKQMKVVKQVDPMEQAQENLKRQMKVFVGGLTDRLAEIQESELKELFDPFGPIDYVDIHRDPQTGKCKGFAFIQYSGTDDAKAAVKDMNGLSIGGQKITVQTVSVVQKGEVTASDQYLHSQGNRDALMAKLSRDAPSHSNLMRPPISTISTPYVLLINLFKMEGKTPSYFQELRKEVMAECAKYGIVEKCFVEKNNQGNVWVKFSDTQSAMKAQEKLNSNFFDGVKIYCYFVTENTYQVRVGN